MFPALFESTVLLFQEISIFYVQIKITRIVPDGGQYNNVI